MNQRPALWGWGGFVFLSEGGLSAGGYGGKNFFYRDVVD